MQIEMKELEEGINRLELKAKALSLELTDEDVGFIDPVTIKLTIGKSSNSFFVDGSVISMAMMSCCRCLEEFESQIAPQFSAIFQREKEARSEDHVEDSEVIIIGFNDTYIDLKAVIRDAILLDVPTKPLCSSDCAGMCHLCGANLNEGPCRCNHTKIDPRWEALAQLKLNS